MDLGSFPVEFSGIGGDRSGLLDVLDATFSLPHRVEVSKVGEEGVSKGGPSVQERSGDGVVDVLPIGGEPIVGLS